MVYKTTKLKLPSPVTAEGFAQLVEDYLNEIQRQIQSTDSLYKPAPSWELISTINEYGHVFFLWRVKG